MRRCRVRAGTFSRHLLRVRAAACGSSSRARRSETRSGPRPGRRRCPRRTWRSSGRPSSITKAVSSARRHDGPRHQHVPGRSASSVSAGRARRARRLPSAPASASAGRRAPARCASRIGGGSGMVTRVRRDRSRRHRQAQLGAGTASEPAAQTRLCGGRGDAHRRRIVRVISGRPGIAMSPWTMETSAITPAWGAVGRRTGLRARRAIAWAFCAATWASAALKARASALSKRRAVDVLLPAGRAGARLRAGRCPVQRQRAPSALPPRSRLDGGARIQPRQHLSSLHAVARP